MLVVLHHWQWNRDRHRKQAKFFSIRTFVTNRHLPLPAMILRTTYCRILHVHCRIDAVASVLNLDFEALERSYASLRALGR